MQHCCSFNPDDVYYLKDNDLYSFRHLSIGFCPICQKPVAQIIQRRFDGILEKNIYSGLEASDYVLKHKNEIEYSMKECNYMKFKSKPFGWKYGINKSVKSGKKQVIKQYAMDFYGNKELIKII